MSASIRVFVVAGIGLIFAVLLGSELGSGEWTIPIIILLTCLLGALLHFFAKGIRPEALILSFLLVGYIAAGRGFANVSLSRTLPLYLGEISLIACTGIMFCRRAFTRQRLIPKTFLGRAILFFIFIGALRLLFDIEKSDYQETTILRDAATVYYALFFFVGYNLANHAKSRNVIDKAIVIGFVFLIPVFVISAFWPDALLHLTVRGFPLILLKGDLAATFLGIGSIYLFLSRKEYPFSFVWTALSLILFALMVLGLMRAAVFGFALAMGLLLYARQWQLAAWQITVGTGAAIILLLVASASTASRQDNAFLRLSDRLLSMTDPSGTKQYNSASGSAAINNTRFRTAWWSAVWDETIDKSPWVGLGFGYDLASRFLVNYDLPLERDFDTRSPHSIFVTIIGRMGLVGLVAFVVVCLGLLKGALGRARQVRRRRVSPYELRHWCAVLMILGAGAFGVVLEGPMGGVLFWSLLGLAAGEPEIETETEATEEPGVLLSSPREVRSPIPV